jgi:tetratricopeptide (TPR) repeat protein/transglutaminase-like putative cysteine protease
MGESQDEASRRDISNRNSRRGGLKLAAIAFFIFLAAAGALGQASSPGNTKTDTTADYSKEAFIIEKLRTVVSFENDGTSRLATTSAVRVQSQAGVEHWGVLSVGYSSTNEQVEIDYVRVHKADGTVVETPSDSAQEVTSEIMRVAPMYTDYREKHVAVKGLGVGDVLDYEITKHLHTPLIPGQFWYAYGFDKTNVVLDEEVEVSVPKDRAVKVKSPDLKPTIVDEGKRRVYTWKTLNRESQKNDEPRREFPAPAILVSTFQSWEEVGRWWNGLEQQSVTPTPEIRAKAAELTRDAATREEKVRALYNYVATHFRYISISFGIGRYQPHGALDVLKNEYGDCKDKHTLLASLLQAVGIEAYPALMNSTHHLDPDVPSPGQFDHVITAVPETPNGGKLIWLDTTTEVAPFGFLAFVLRDKPALVIPSTAPPSLVTTPADPPFKNFERYEIDAKLNDNGVLEGKVQRSFRGDSELLLRIVFRQVPQSQWKDLVQRISQATGFAGEVSEVEAGSPEATNEPYSFTNKYTRKDYPDWANHRITAPVGFVGVLEIKESEKRTQPIFLGAPEEIINIAKVELPTGYTPKLLPGVDLVRDFAEYHSSYAYKDGVFVTEVRITIKKAEIPLAALDDYKSFQKAVSDNQNLYTELKNAAESLYATPTPTPAPSPNPEATRLVQKAREAYAHRDVDGASEMLERALKLDAHYEDAWLQLGDVRLDQGRFDEGLTAFRKAIDSDPKDTRSYMRLASAYESLLRPEESIKVWREALKQDPNQRDVHFKLGIALLGLKRFSEAVPELEAALPVNGLDVSLELDLGNAYLGSGNSDKGVKALKAAGEGSRDPKTWNEVASALADHNVSLLDAQLYAVRAVHSVEDRAVQLSLTGLNSADLNCMPQLASYWDTLGWVYFRQGDPEKAQKYVDAAWNLEQTRVIGEHLAQIYEKQGRKEAAEHQHALAQAVPDPERVRIAVGNSGNIVGPHRPEQNAPAQELLQMRRTTLGKLSAQKGHAEFFVLLAPGGSVEDVKFIRGDEQIRPLGRQLASLKFKAPLPDDAPVKIVRRGALLCNGGESDCEFTLFHPSSVHFTE